MKKHTLLQPEEQRHLSQPDTFYNTNTSLITNSWRPTFVHPFLGAICDTHWWSIGKRWWRELLHTQMEQWRGRGAQRAEMTGDAAVPQLGDQHHLHHQRGPAEDVMVHQLRKVDPGQSGLVPTCRPSRTSTPPESGDIIFSPPWGLQRSAHQHHHQTYKLHSVDRYSSHLISKHSSSAITMQYWI